MSEDDLVVVGFLVGLLCWATFGYWGLVIAALVYLILKNISEAGDD